MFDICSLFSPRNADKFLFAENFVNYILSLFELPSLSMGVRNRPATLYNAFNTDVRLVANYFFKKWQEDMRIEYDEFAMNNEMNRDTFFTKINPVRLEALETLFPIEHGAFTYMVFCAKVSMIAAHFSTRGFKGALSTTVFIIMWVILDVDMVREGGWEALRIEAAELAQYFTDIAPYHLTPPGTDSSNSDDAPSIEDSDAYQTPNDEMDIEEVQEENSEKPTDADSCETCMAVMRSPSEEPIPSSSSCTHLENKMVITPVKIESSSGNASCSSEEISSKDDTPKQKKRKRRKKRPSYSYSNSSSSDSDNGKRVRKR